MGDANPKKEWTKTCRSIRCVLLRLSEREREREREREISAMHRIVGGKETARGLRKTRSFVREAVSLWVQRRVSAGGR
jgi:hypothetical protein